MVFAVSASFLLGCVTIVHAQESGELRPVHYKKWRENPKMIVFGDSASDAGRKFHAPASFDFEDIGPFPWTRLFEAPDSDRIFQHPDLSPMERLGLRGSAYPRYAFGNTYGRLQSDLDEGRYLRSVPGWGGDLVSNGTSISLEYNFATSSATATDVFRSREACTGYTGEGEEFPTGTLSEQVTRYFYDVLDETDQTLDYSHLIIMGANEPSAVLSAFSRYTAGGAGYVDPVAFENVFEVVDGIPALTFEPMIREVIGAWQDAINRLVERGVTGNIFLSNIPSFKGLPGVAESGLADMLDQVSIAVNSAAQLMIEGIPQVRIIDAYSLTAAIVDQPEVFESLGFTGGSESSLSEACLTFDFAVDRTAEIMGTQAGRAVGCREECALCADETSPCQNCYQGNPSATVCEEPDKYLFWDSLHFTSAFHQILGEATRQCTKDTPDYDRAWVELLCP